MEKPNERIRLVFSIKDFKCCKHSLSIDMSIDKLKPLPAACTCCGYSNVPARVMESVDNRGNSVKRIKWLCPRCGQVSRKETIS